MTSDYEQADLFDLLDDAPPAKKFTAYYYAGTFGYRCGWCGAQTGPHTGAMLATWNGRVSTAPGAICRAICKTCAHIPGHWSPPPQDTWQIEGDPEWKP